MGELVLVAAALAQRPGRAGHAWVVRNWLAGARQAGFEVVFVDHVDPSLGDVTVGVQWVADVIGSAGFGWIVLTPDGTSAGLTRRALVDRARHALLLNLNGYLRAPDVLDRVECRVMVDIDPGFGQVWQHTGLATPFTGHDAYVTVGLNVGREGCAVPDLGLPWISTLPPVDLTSWSWCPPASDGPFTTVASWRGPFAPVELDGVVHGLRVHEARAYADVPERSGAPMEMVLDIDPSDGADRDRLIAGGWTLRDPEEVAGDLERYRRYIAGSVGEFSVAKQAYVTLRTGWFSDRTACYLATGRAAIVSDTGLSHRLPVGEGLLTYSGPDEALAAIADVRDDPVRHGKAARALAEEHLDARRVVADLVERLP